MRFGGSRYYFVRFWGSKCFVRFGEVGVLWFGKYIFYEVWGSRYCFVRFGK